LSAVFLGILAFIWLTNYLWTESRFPSTIYGFKGLPPTVVRLLLFLWVVCISWLFTALFLEPPPFRGETPLTLAPGSFLTLGLGAGVFFTAAAWLVTQPLAIQRTIRLINYVGLVVILWSLVQAYFVFLNDSQYPDLLYRIQGLFSASSAGLYVGRVTGLAFEPSWLGHQLNIMFLPIWLAYTVTRQSLFRRIGPISLENILFVLGVVILLVSFSRIGWISLTLVLLVTAMIGAVKIANHFKKNLLSNFPAAVQEITGYILTPVIILLMVVLLGLVGAAAFRVGVLVEPRLALILENNPFSATSLYDFANRLFFGERMVYWATGLSIFAKHPFFGVGLGNVGLYFPENLPGFGYWLPEVVNSVYRLPGIMNTKSLWIRLLAETGMVGFTVFIYWLISLFNAGLAAWRSRERDLQVVGISGLFMLVALLAEGFSIDSFALPYIWFMAALITAAAIKANRLPA
jgi:O-antigen ligase